MKSKNQQTANGVLVSVKLIADGGAAMSPEFFRSENFLRAERVSHSLVIEDDGGRATLPLICRLIDGTNLFDGISPYGYTRRPPGRRAATGI